MAVLSRRSLLAGLAAFTAAAPRPSHAQFFGAHPAPPPTLSSVRVDANHLREIGAGPFADIVEAAMSDELRRVLADRIGQRGPRLVVRVTTLFLTTLPEGHGWRHFGGGNGTSTDSIEGEALVVGSRGEILARYPQHAVLVPQGAWYDPLNEQRRADAVARQYARWLRWTVGYS